MVAVSYLKLSDECYVVHAITRGEERPTTTANKKILILQIELMFAGVNMFMARLRLVLARGEKTIFALKFSSK